MKKRTVFVLLLAIAMVLAIPAFAQDVQPTPDPDVEQPPVEEPADPAVEQPVDPALEQPTDPAMQQTGEMGVVIEMGELTANTEAYYGQVVTVEGNMTEFLNVRAFILDDEALLAENRVLVINNSPASFDITLRPDLWLRVTGVVHPAYNEGGWDQFDFTASQQGMTQQPMGQTDPLAATPVGTDPDAATEGDPGIEGDLVATPIGDENLIVQEPGMFPGGVMVQNYNDINMRNMFFPEWLHHYTILEIRSMDAIVIVEQ
jgi:hypothetical protein